MLHLNLASVQFSQSVSQSVSSVTQSCLTLCNPMNLSMPDLPVHHQIPEITQTHDLSTVQLFATSWTAACMASLSITNSRSLLKLRSIKSVMSSNQLILCHPLLFLLSIFSDIRVLSSESALPIRWSEYWSFSFSISSSNEYSGLISFRIDWFGILAVQGTLKSLLQHDSSKASILWCSAFFTVQLSYPYVTIGKNHSFD